MSVRSRCLKYEREERARTVGRDGRARELEQLRTYLDRKYAFVRKDVGDMVGGELPRVRLEEELVGGHGR